MFDVPALTPDEWEQFRKEQTDFLVDARDGSVGTEHYEEDVVRWAEMWDRTLLACNVLQQERDKAREDLTRHTLVEELPAVKELTRQRNEANALVEEMRARAEKAEAGLHRLLNVGKKTGALRRKRKGEET